LSLHLSKKITFLKGGNKTNPCERTTRGVLAELSPCEEIPSLEGIVSAPVIRADGTILDRPGYDRASKLFYAPAKGLVVPPISPEPTEDEIAKARAVIDDAIGDFPFKDESSKANAIAAIITPIVRPVIEGPTPLAVFDAAAPGTGKTLLAEVESIIATGTEGAMTTAPKSRDEWRKKITSVLREGAPVVIFDNVSNRLEQDELMSALSAVTWSDRLLGSSQQVNVPVLCAWVATSNNIQLEGQMTRRSYWVRMDAKSAQPYLRSGFKHPNLRAYVKQNRGNLLAALLTLARSWFANGKPAPDVGLLGSFESWTTVVGGILKNAGINGFLGNSDELYLQSDDETPAWEGLLSQIDEIFKGEPFITAALVEKMRLSQHDDLKESIEIIFGDAVNQIPTLKQHIAKAFKIRIDKRFGKDGGPPVLVTERRYSPQTGAVGRSVK
jgi:hypothetical protein